MLMIRFQRIGRTNDPAFRIVVLEKERAAKTGRVTDLVGTYNPKSKAMTLDEARVKDWISKGAQLSPSLKNLLITKGILEGKKVNVVSKKNIVKAVEAPVVDVAAPVAKEEVVEEVKVEETLAEVPVEEAPAEEVKTEEAPVV